MAWIETWLDTAFAPDAATVLGACNAAGASGVNFYLGGRFSAGRGWSLRLNDQVTAAGLGVLLTWVALEPGQGGYAIGHQDGLDAAAAAVGWRGWGLCYDVEPITWNRWPAGVSEAIRGFIDAVHASNWRATLYGLPATCNAPGTAAADAVWIARPGEPDPALAGVPGFVGQRSVQWSQAVYEGVTWDVSHAEFRLVPPPVPPPPALKEIPMEFFMWNGNQNLVRIQANGVLVHGWYGGQSWNQEALGVGYLPDQLAVDWTSVPNQLHVWAGNPDGSVAHFWQVAGQATWSTETLPKI